MYRAVIEINAAGAAFGEDERQADREVARILRDLADRFEHGGHTGALRDVNGNRCGDVNFHDAG